LVTLTVHTSLLKFLQNKIANRAKKPDKYNFF